MENDLVFIIALNMVGNGFQKFTKALIETLQKHENVTGLFWWWMEANEYGRTGSSQVTTDWYNAALWNDQTGKVTPAFYELQTFLGDDAHVSSPNVDETAKNEWYTIDGKRVAAPNHKGVYIRDHQKVVVK